MRIVHLKKDNSYKISDNIQLTKQLWRKNLNIELCTAYQPMREEPFIDYHYTSSNCPSSSSISSRTQTRKSIKKKMTHQTSE